MTRLARSALTIGCLALAIPLFLCGCNGQGSTTTVFDVLQTALLGVTAAGAVVLIREV